MNKLFLFLLVVVLLPIFTIAQDYVLSDDARTNMCVNPTNSFEVQIANSPALYVDSSCNVGIGTTAPSNKLHIVGAVVGAAPFSYAEVVIEDSTDGLCYIHFLTSTNGWIGFQFGNPNDLDDGSIRYKGDLGLMRFYTESTLAAWFENDQDLNMNVHNVVNESDARSKTNVVSLTGMSEKVDALRPVQFEYTNGLGNVRMGLIAQEVEPIFPEAVNTDYRGIKGLKYSALIPALIQAFSEQKAEVEALKAEVEKLKNP